jgi:signal transduction histidine kinase
MSASGREDGAGRDDTPEATPHEDWFGLLVLAAFGVALATVNVLHVLDPDGVVTRETLPALLAPGLVAVADATLLVWAARTRLGVEHALRVTGWVVAWAGLFGVVGGLVSVSAAGDGYDVLAGTSFEPVLAWACGGFVIGAFVGVFDVRSRRRAAEIDRARREVEQLAETLTVLNRVLRHDIRTDANVISGYADLLEGDDDEEYAAVVKRRARKIVDLAEQARQAEKVVRSEDGSLAAVDLAAVTRRVAREVREEHPEADIGVNAPRTASARGHDLVGAAIRNLVENAVEHGGAGVPTVRATVSTDEDRVEVRVADDGPGIPEGEVAVLEAGSESALEHSSGMGLWLVNWIVERSGGDVEFDRSDLGGSAVVLSFVRTDAAEDARTAEDRPTTPTERYPRARRLG